MNSLLSVLIPTKNRPETLEACLLSCARVQFADIEFVIIDNASSDSTASACKPFLSDNRFRYLRFDTRGSINDQFRRAVDASLGDWLCIIGDDDALLPISLVYFATKLTAERDKFDSVQVIRWPDAIYRWPDFLGPEANLLKFHSVTGNVARSNIDNSREMLPSVSKNIKATYQAPGLYHNFIKRKFVNYLLKTYPETIFFLSPDISIRVHCIYESIYYMTLPWPITLAGYSSSSTGASNSGTGRPDIRQAFWSENPDWIEALESAIEIRFSDFGNDPPCSEVLATYAIFCKIAKERGVQAPQIESYIRSELSNASKLTPLLRPKVKLIVQKVLERHNLTADLSAFDSSLPSRSLGEPHFALVPHNDQYNYSTCVKLPLGLVSNANQASLFLEAFHSSMQQMSIGNHPLG